MRPLRVFREFEKQELAFVSRFKKGELAVDKGATLLVEGNHSAHLYTVLSGWGFRYKLMPDGRRQILNYPMPGDLVGLQGSLMGEMQHSVEALSPMLLCVFEREDLHELYRKHPGLAYDITWIASREEQMLDENLLSVGRRSAQERAAYLIAFIGRGA
ncbi:transcriptional regulator, partial [Mesorhizobium alhagi CCNWXJ12-2]